MRESNMNRDTVKSGAKPHAANRALSRGACMAIVCVVVLLSVRRAVCGLV